MFSCYVILRQTKILNFYQTTDGILIFYSLYRNIWPLQLDNVYITAYSNLETSVAASDKASTDGDMISHSSEIMLWKVRCDHRQNHARALWALISPSKELEETSWTAKAQMFTHNLDTSSTLRQLANWHCSREGHNIGGDHDKSTVIVETIAVIIIDDYGDKNSR